MASPPASLPGGDGVGPRRRVLAPPPGAHGTRSAEPAPSRGGCPTRPATPLCDAATEPSTLAERGYRSRALTERRKIRSVPRDVRRQGNRGHEARLAAFRNGSQKTAAKRQSDQRFAAWRDEYKVAQGCVDCGYNAHPAALDFDHRDPSSKLFGLSSGGKFGWDKVMAEIAKCDIRCSNCHRIRTAEQRVLRGLEFYFPGLNDAAVVEPDFLF